MANNPISGAVPLHLRRSSREEIAKSTSYRSGEVHPVFYRTPHADKTIMPREDGNTILRRYPNGQLCIAYVAHKIIDIIHKMEDRGHVTDFEKAILSLILPDSFGKLVNSKIAQAMTKLSNDERMLLAVCVNKHMKEELNYNAGRGGGSVRGRGVTRS